MAREPRREFAGAVHHVYARGTGRQVIYIDDEDRRRYLRLLGREVRRTRWRCLAYCLMANHVHLVLETPEPNLGAGMQRLHGDYARAFNHRHDRVGHLFQGRFGSVLIVDDGQLWQTLGYVARNPVEAGLCADARAWPWSSFAPAGGSRPPWLAETRLFELLGAAGGDPRRRYEDVAA